MKLLMKLLLLLLLVLCAAAACSNDKSGTTTFDSNSNSDGDSGSDDDGDTAGDGENPFTVNPDVTVISNFETAGEWSGGTIDTTLSKEGASSLRWNQSDDICTDGTCRVILDPLETIDISSGDLLSIWVHNDVPSGALERTGDDYTYYGKTAEDVLQFTFANEDNGWYGINFIRLDFVGWKRFVFSKASFVNAFDNPSVLDFIDRIWISVIDQYGTGITERTLHLDAFTQDRGRLHSRSDRFVNPIGKFIVCLE